MSSAKHFYISGRVQGVAFRASTQERAAQLGLSGWVRNLDDGRVEALACGPAEALQKLENWLWQGPVQARVDDVSAHEVNESDQITDTDKFSVR